MLYLVNGSHFPTPLLYNQKTDEFNALCIPFENSLSEEQIDIFHQILDCVSDTAAAEMRAAYKVGFKDGATMM